MRRSILLTVCCSLLGIVAAGSFGANAAETVTVDNFVRAETDQIFKSYVNKDAFGKFLHVRAPVALDKQDVIRMNRDTLYSAAVVDASQGATLTLPDSKGRYMSVMIVSEDHRVEKVYHEPGTYRLSVEEHGSRFVAPVMRIFVDPEDPDDVRAVNELQHSVIIEGGADGSYTHPEF